jgi:predicted nucleic acid-binding Zn ribbon protein
MAWVVICGRAMAERARVVGYEEGVVRIMVQGNAWLEEMRAMSSHLEGELSRVAGIKVSRLHFIVKR